MNANDSFGERAITRVYLFRLFPEGHLDPSFTVDFFADRNTRSREIHRIAMLPDDQILVAGSFDAVNGISRPGLVRLTRDGEVDSTFVPQFAGTTGAPIVFVVTAMRDGSVLASVGEPVGHRLVKLRSDGKPDPEFQSSFFNDVITYIHAAADGRIIVTGHFDRVGDEARSGMAWFDSRGRLLPPVPMRFRPTLSELGSTRKLDIEARFTGRAILERTLDLRTWVPIDKINLVPGLVEVPWPMDDSPAQFLRLRRDAQSLLDSRENDRAP